MSHIKRILLPTDFSPTSNRAIDYAIDIARRYGAAVHLLHVIDDPLLAGNYPEGFFGDSVDLRMRRREEAARQLTAAAVRFLTEDVGATTEVAVGSPAPVIHDRALARGADLIVMGTHGRTGFAHVLLGSMAERTVRSAPCPVLTVGDAVRVVRDVARDGALRMPAPALAG